jgi:hypothetical protein
MSTPSRSNIRHFWLRDKKNNRVAVVATQPIDPVNHPNTVNFAVATHNPKDKFNPKTALNVVLGRLKFSSAGNVINTELGSVKAQILKHLATDIVVNAVGYKDGVYDTKGMPQYPERTRRAARLWLKNHPQPVEKE